MKTNRPQLLPRRSFVRAATLSSLSLLAAPFILRGVERKGAVPTRVLGRTGFSTPLFSLGGQGSLQWTGADIDPVAIITKAYGLGVRYFDTSNNYGPSQLNYGKAFRQLGLTPGAPGYDEKRRRSVFVATKTGVRINRGTIEKVRNFSDGGPGSSAVDDLMRSMSQLFGDGAGGFPADAYLDSVQLHAIGSRRDVDACFTGYEDPSPDGPVGSLAVLRDYRDGTNLTGLNPSRRKLIRHIGITGHHSSDALMHALRRDKQNLFETLLVPANANDRRYISHIHNIVPIAAAKGLGIVSMKVFADGAFYGKQVRFSRNPSDVILRIGSPEMPSARLLQYPLTVPGITTNIVGIGRIHDDPAQCQLAQNWRDSQMEEGPSRPDLAETENMAGQIAGGKTNYFQRPTGEEILRPDEARFERTADERPTVRLLWDSALAGPAPIARYEIHRDGQPIGQVAHRLQLTSQPFEFVDRVPDRAAHRYEIRAIDTAGATAPGTRLEVPALG